MRDDVGIMSPAIDGGAWGGVCPGGGFPWGFRCSVFTSPGGFRISWSALRGFRRRNLRVVAKFKGIPWGGGRREWNYAMSVWPLRGARWCSQPVYWRQEEVAFVCTNTENRGHCVLLRNIGKLNFPLMLPFLASKPSIELGNCVT